MLTDLRSPNIDAPSECGSLHGGPTSSRMAVMLGGSFGPSRSGVVIAANRFKRSNALVYQPAPVASHGLPGYFPQWTPRMLVSRFGRRVVDRGGWAAPLRSQVRRRMLAVVGGVGVLAAMHVHHRALDVDMPQLVPDRQHVSAPVAHVGCQTVAHQEI